MATRRSTSSSRFACWATVRCAPRPVSSFAANPGLPRPGPAPTLPHLTRDAAIEEVEPTPGEDMLDALARGAPSGAAATLLASLTAEPPWLDWGLLARGQEVYLRHLPSAGLVLFNVCHTAL